MGISSDSVGKAGLALAGFIFRIVLYVFMGVLIFWCGRHAYQFGYEVFSQQPLAAENGREIIVSIPEGAGDVQIARILQERGVVHSAPVFLAQEILVGYYGRLRSGNYTLVTSDTPAQIMGILAGEESPAQGGEAVSS